MDHEEAGCEALEGPILCINNCGFFGGAATMNMCSKCHQALVLNQENAKLAASSIENLVNGNSSTTTTKEPVIADGTTVQSEPITPKPVSTESSSEPKEALGPKRCGNCRKRVGLTGFNCKCGNIFCAVHRYSEKHECPFDYRKAGQTAIAKANPVVKAEKLDKI